MNRRGLLRALGLGAAAAVVPAAAIPNEDHVISAQQFEQLPGWGAGKVSTLNEGTVRITKFLYNGEEYWHFSVADGANG